MEIYFLEQTKEHSKLLFMVVLDGKSNYKETWFRKTFACNSAKFNF